MNLKLPPGIDFTGFYGDIIALATIFVVFGVMFGAYHLISKGLKKMNGRY